MEWVIVTGNTGNAYGLGMPSTGNGVVGNVTL